jgi:hypothetical protein
LAAVGIEKAGGIAVNFWQRIKDLFRMMFGGFVESAEDNVPVERRLAYDRVKRAENLKKQMGAAEDVGAAAEMMVQQLAEARIVSANVRQQAKTHLLRAQAAAAKGDTVTQQQEEAAATQLANELAESDAEVRDLEALVEDSLSDKKEAIQMVLDQSRELEKLARGDQRLVARARMTDMRKQQLELREQMMDLVPGDQSNQRARIQEQIGKDEARYRARRDVVDAMWDAKTDARKSSQMETTAAGQVKLDELMNEVGYTTSAQTAANAAAAAAPAQQASEAQAKLDELKREVGYSAEAGASDGSSGGSGSSDGGTTGG